MARSEVGRAAPRPDKWHANERAILSIRQSEGLPVPLPALSKAAFVAAAALLLLVVLGVGCGGGEGAAEGASVTAYVDASLCGEAKQALAREGGRVDSLRVRVSCLEPTRTGARLDLATVGANARRASEDSTAIAYVEAPDPKAARFSETILESAGIPHLVDNSGQAAMSDLLKALSEADLNSLRDSVSDELQ